MKKLLLLFIVSVSLVACTSENKTGEISEDNSKHQMIFENNIKYFEQFLQAHYEENVQKVADIMSDTLKWGRANQQRREYSSKKDLLEALKGYYIISDSIKLIDPYYSSGIRHANDEGILVEYGDNPNNIRVFGTWDGIIAASGKKQTNKWFGVIRFNEAGKIIFMDEYFDVSGVINNMQE